MGSIEHSDGIGEVGNAKCGDIIKIFLKLAEEAIHEEINDYLKKKDLNPGQNDLHNNTYY